MAGKTSLASQLERLKVPQTSVHKETHGAVSFLYDFFEAKSIDAETHFSVAVAGLEGLAAVDPYVATFRETLFSESSKSLDRGVLTAERNEQLDALLEEYLFRVVSKYFQLTDTHKTIEWLLYRYRVNEYNTGALIGAILPYHETRHFVRLLQTCSAVKNPNNSLWSWLKPIQASGVPLTKSVLLQYCTRPSGLEFIRFITDSVFKAMQVDGANVTFPSFLTSFCVNLLERTAASSSTSTSNNSHNNEKTVLMMIISVVAKAMRAKNAPQLYVASYLIFAHLCTTTKLQTEVVESFIASLLRRIKPDFYEGVLMSLTIVVHSQQLSTLPAKYLNDELIAHLMATIDNISTAPNNQTTVSFEPLLRALLLTIVDAASKLSGEEGEGEEWEKASTTALERYKAYCEQLMSDCKAGGITKSTVVAVVKAVNRSIASEEKKVRSAEAEDLLAHLLETAKSANPGWFEDAIELLHEKNEVLNEPLLTYHQTLLAKKSLMSKEKEAIAEEEAKAAEAKKKLEKVAQTQKEKPTVDLKALELLSEKLTSAAGNVPAKLAIFKDYYERFFAAHGRTDKFSADEEGQLKVLLGSLNAQEDEEGLFAEDEEGKPNYVCAFYLATVEASKSGLLSLSASLAVYHFLKKATFDVIRATNLPFALSLVATLLRLQLTLSEGGGVAGSEDSMTLVNAIKSRLRRLNTDGDFITAVMQHLLPVEGVRDAFGYASLAKTGATSGGGTLAEKRLRKGPEADSKFTVAWKLLRIYMSTFQSKDSIENSGLLMRTLFDYLKLTFMELGDNSSEYTRQTLLYTVANCLEAKLGDKTGKQSSKQKRKGQQEVESMEVDIDAEGEARLLPELLNFNVDIIVDCMRESRVRETQRVALLLLGQVAPYFRRAILDYLVEIFTFIGTSLLQCDDQYSLAILFETLEAVIPIVLSKEKKEEGEDTKKEKKGKKVKSGQNPEEDGEEEDMSAYIISIFVKAFPDIPSYRRLPLFTKLVQLLGERRFLPILSVRLLEEAVLLKSRTAKAEREVVQSFLLTLLGQFAPSLQLETLCTLLALFDGHFFDHHLKRRRPWTAPQNKSLQLLSSETMLGGGRGGVGGNSQKVASAAALKEYSEHCQSLVAAFASKIVFDSDKAACGVELLRLVVSAIGSPAFVAACHGMSVEAQVGVKVSESKKQRPFRSPLLIYLLNQLLEMMVSLGESGGGQQMMKSASLLVYRRRIKATLDEALLKYHSLLSSRRLIEIVTGDLLQEGQHQNQQDPSVAGLVRRKALELLNEKLLKMGADEMTPELTLTVLQSLSVHLVTERKSIRKLDDVSLHNLQLTVASIKFATKFIAAGGGGKKELPDEAELEQQLQQQQNSVLSELLGKVCQMAASIEVVTKKRSASVEEDGAKTMNSRSKSLQNLKGACILTLTQLLCSMGLEGLEHLATVVELILASFDEVLSTGKDEDTVLHIDDIVILSNVCALSKLVGTFAAFLSPHLRAIIGRLLQAYTVADQVNGLRGKLQSSWSVLAKLVPKRVLFEAINGAYEEAVEVIRDPVALVELMALFRLACDSLQKAEVEPMVKSFKGFMIKALEYRSRAVQEEVDLATIEAIETAFGEAFSAFIPKLNEATFRPIFYRLLEWALQIEGVKKKNKKSGGVSLPDVQYHRMIAFYRFTSLLADRLKSLFCVFVAPSIVGNAGEMLTAYHSANFEDMSSPMEVDGGDFMAVEEKTASKAKAEAEMLKLREASLGEPLVGAILSTLSKCFLYDLNGAFVNKDVTSVIVKPIVNQISNLFGTAADFETRLGLILQCTQYLIQNNKDEALIKEFNYQILLKTRESSEKVRVGAIKVLHRLILTCSEDYLPFIPEAIPFIAELSEDDAESVEAAVKKLIVDIEELVGEPINKYL